MQDSTKLAAHILDAGSLGQFLENEGVNEENRTKSIAKFAEASFYAYRTGSTASSTPPNGLGLVQYQIEGSRLFATMSTAEAQQHLGDENTSLQDTWDVVVASLVC